MLAWLFGIGLVLTLWIFISIYAFITSLPNVFSLTWKERVLYGPILVTAAVLASVHELKYKWDLKRGKVLETWKHK
jgi:hypothetical protein